MDLEKIKEYRNTSDPFAKEMGFEVTKIDTGYAYAETPVRPDLLNALGAVHGGCLYTIADCVGGVAALTHGEYVVTSEGGLHYLNAALNTTRIYAESRELKKGKRLLVYDVTVKDQDGVLLAEGIFSYMTVGRKLELDH